MAKAVHLFVRKIHISGTLSAMLHVQQNSKLNLLVLTNAPKTTYPKEAHAFTKRLGDRDFQLTQYF